MSSKARISENRLPDGTLKVLIVEKELSCLVCGNNTFHQRTALLNSRANEFFGLG